MRNSLSAEFGTRSFPFAKAPASAGLRRGKSEDGAEDGMSGPRSGGTPETNGWKPFPRSTTHRGRDKLSPPLAISGLRAHFRFWVGFINLKGLTWSDLV